MAGITYIQGIPFKEAGTTECQDCDGFGNILVDWHDNAYDKCLECNGTGEVSLMEVAPQPYDLGEDLFNHIVGK